MNEQLKIIISAEIDKLKSSVKAAKGEIDSFKSSTGTSSEAIKQSLTTIGTKAQAAGKVIATGIAAGTTALMAASAATEEYRNNQAKLDAAFKTAGASAGTATQVYNDLYRVLGDDDVSVEAANHLAQLTTNQKDLSEWTTICQGVYATFGDSLPIEGLTEAANETAKTGVVTGSLADALNWAGVSEDAFNEKLAKCNTEAEREALIRNTLNGIYDEAAANYEKTAADVIAQNEAQAQLTASLAQVGAAMAPVLTAFTAFAAEALAVIVPYIQQIAEQYGPALKETLSNIASALEPIAAFIANNLPLIATIAGIILAIGAAYTVATGALAAYTTITELWSAVTTIATAVQTAFAAVNMAALAPILAVVAAIAAVVAIIVVCVKHWDEIKATVEKVVTAITDKVKEMKDKVVKFFEELKTQVSEKIEAFKTMAQTKFDAIKTAINTKVQAIRDLVKAIFEGMKGDIQAKLETAKTIIKNVIALIKGVFTGDFGACKTAVLNIFDAIKSGIQTRINNAKTAVKNAINAMKGFFNFSWSLPKIKMPKITISGKFSLNPPSAPKFSINWNRLGGIFDKPTLFNYGGSLQGLGEDGAEAVVPLEKNTQWLDRLAERLSAKQNGIPIILQVDGKTFAQVSIDSINALTKQRGTLGLNLV